MNGRALNLAILNFVGGVCVISGYLYGAMARDVSGAWGGIPADWQSFYTVSMVAAAIGYFPFTYFFLRHVDLEDGSFAGGFGYATIAWSYVLIMIPSSIWLPMTIRMLRAPSTALWIAIRLDLLLVAGGSLALLIAAATYSPVRSPIPRATAIVGLIFFCFQTVVLDAVVWPALFPR